MRFQKIRNFGGKFGATVKAVFEAELVGDLLQHSIGELQTKLGEDSGKFVWEILRGIDYTEGAPESLPASPPDGFDSRGQDAG